MELTRRLRAWSYARQRIGAPADSPLEALRAVVAVYATHPTAPLALWARSKTFTLSRYRRLDRDRRAVRIPAMRRTVFLVPRKDAATIFGAVRSSPAHALRALKRHGFSPDDYERFAASILAAADSPTTTRALEHVAGIGGQQLGTVLRCLRHEGRLLAIAGDTPMSSPHRYVATRAWAPELLDDEPSVADRLAWLAGRYLHAYGPARVEDFAWWAGITRRVAATAIASGPTLDVGEGRLLPTDDAAAFERVTPVRRTVDLLPKWDAYTMGLAPDGRSRFVHPDVQDRVYTPIGVGLPGDGNPVVLADGQAVATWTFTKRDGPAVQPFDTFGPTVRRRVDERLDAVVSLLNG